jgi:hypothetical protein
MILGSNTQSMEIVLGAAPATSNPRWGISYNERNGTTGIVTPQPSNAGQTSGTTPVTLIAAPASGNQRVESEFGMSNTDTAPIEVTIQLNDGGTRTPFFTFILQIGDNLVCNKQGEWKVKDSNGAEKTSVDDTSSPPSVQTPSGTIDGTNTTFTVAAFSVLLLYRNGLLLTVGVDYTLSGSTITMTSAPLPASGPTPADTLIAVTFS